MFTCVHFFGAMRGSKQEATSMMLFVTSVICKTLSVTVQWSEKDRVVMVNYKTFHMRGTSTQVSQLSTTFVIHFWFDRRYQNL